MDFENIVRKRKSFNGKPFSHWQAKADELVIEAILRAALPHVEAQNPSIISYLAGKRLMEIAQGENPTMVQRVLAKRDRMLAGFSRVLGKILQ